MSTRRLALIVVTLSVLTGCSSPALTGNFDQVSSQLIAMSPGERAINYGANQHEYQTYYGLYYDSFQDALYTKSGKERRYLMEGDLLRSGLLIDRRTDEEKGLTR